MRSETFPGILVQFDFSGRVSNAARDFRDPELHVLTALPGALERRQILLLPITLSVTLN